METIERELVNIELDLTIVSDRTLIELYKTVGYDAGHAISYLGIMGPCHGFGELILTLEKIEAESARRGFITVDISTLVSYGGYGHDFSNLFSLKRSKGEEPQFPVRDYINRLKQRQKHQ